MIGFIADISPRSGTPANKKTYLAISFIARLSLNDSLKGTVALINYVEGRNTSLDLIQRHAPLSSDISCFYLRYSMMRDHECGVISIQTSVLRETILYKTDAVGRVIC